MRHLAANVLTLLIALGLVVAGLIVYAKHEFEAPGPLAAPVIFTVEPGATLKAVTPRLGASGIIKSETLFRLGAHYGGQSEALRFGEYEVPAGASMAQVLALLTSGDSVDYKITVAEGLTSWQVVELIRQNPVLTGDINELPPEGSIAPDTYFVVRGQTRAEVLARMRAAQDALLAEVWARRAPGLPVTTPQEAVTLASIVEKETGVAAERPRVASVFVNRLRRGMRLQSDPTVVYGLTLGQGALGRGLRRSELDKPTPYNTYTIDGLPPGPIANPGRAAIEAVLAPEASPYLYFVADGSGGHAFATSLDEHNANVARWRAIERAQGLTPQ